MCRECAKDSCPSSHSWFVHHARHTVSVHCAVNECVSLWIKYGWRTHWIEQDSGPAREEKTICVFTFSVLISCGSCCSSITSVWRGKNELTFSAQDGCEEVITEVLDFLFFEERRTPSWQVHRSGWCSFQLLSFSIEMKVKQSHRWHLGMNFARTTTFSLDLRKGCGCECCWRIQLH